MKEETKCYCGHTTYCDCGPEQNKMRNIHILPTPNESRLYYNSQEKAYQLCEFPKYHTDIKSTHNMYITSDEEIYDEELHLCTKYNELHSHKHRNNTDTCKKIILTDNKDLIEDGVQPIDDEFLEWFIKNPTCEFVGIGTSLLDGKDGYGYYGKYKIIIPKEELSKDEIDKFFVDMICNPKEEPKQETTLEEAEKEFEKLINGKGLPTKQLLEVAEHYFIVGYEIAKENNYSEEEVIAFCECFAFELNHYGYPTNENILKALKQFKNKL